MTTTSPEALQHAGVGCPLSRLIAPPALQQVAPDAGVTVKDIALSIPKRCRNARGERESACLPRFRLLELDARRVWSWEQLLDQVWGGFCRG